MGSGVVTLIMREKGWSDLAAKLVMGQSSFQSGNQHYLKCCTKK